MKLSFDFLNGLALGIAFPPDGITLILGPMCITLMKK
jgi:hypothetical protein